MGLGGWIENGLLAEKELNDDTSQSRTSPCPNLWPIFFSTQTSAHKIRTHVADNHS